jgi:hypothetical protein
MLALFYFGRGSADERLSVITMRSMVFPLLITDSTTTTAAPSWPWKKARRVIVPLPMRSKSGSAQADAGRHFPPGCFLCS